MIEEGWESLLARDRRRKTDSWSKREELTGFEAFLAPFDRDPSYAGASGQNRSKIGGMLGSGVGKRRKRVARRCQPKPFVYLRLKSSHTGREIKEIKEKKLT